MKTPSACGILTFTVLATSIFSSAKSPDQADPWLVLNKITHRRSYEIETRDRRCIWATITEVTPDHLTAKVHPSNSSRSLDTVILPRTDIWRVRSGRFVYYSGRSSWSDVSSLRVKGRERLKIITTAGKSYKVKPPYTLSDEGITLHTS